MYAAGTSFNDLPAELIKVRSAMLATTFDVASPARAANSIAPGIPIPSLYYAPVGYLPQWEASPAFGVEPAAKRRRIGEAGSSAVSQSTPVSSMSSTVPLLAMRPPGSAMPIQTGTEISETEPGTVTETYFIDGVRDADLKQCVQLLGLEYDSGLELMRTVFRNRESKLMTADERVNWIKKAYSLLELTATTLEQRSVEFPEELLEKMLASTVNYLIKSYYFIEKRKSAYAHQMPELSLRLFNKSPRVLHLIDKYAPLTSVPDCNFAGGKTKLQFIRWCVGQEIQLADNEIDALFKIGSWKNIKENSRVYELIKAAVSIANKN